LRAPGFDLASSTRSAIEFTGSVERAITVSGLLMIGAIAAKSFPGSIRGLENKCGATASELTLPRSSV